jgi:hypothetical protein
MRKIILCKTEADQEFERLGIKPTTKDYQLFGIYRVDGYADILMTGERLGKMTANLLGIRSKKIIDELVENAVAQTKTIALETAKSDKIVTELDLKYCAPNDIEIMRAMAYPGIIESVIGDKLSKMLRAKVLTKRRALGKHFYDQRRDDEFATRIVLMNNKYASPTKEEVRLARLPQGRELLEYAVTFAFERAYQRAEAEGLVVNGKITKKTLFKQWQDQARKSVVHELFKNYSA